MWILGIYSTSFIKDYTLFLPPPLSIIVFLYCFSSCRFLTFYLFLSSTPVTLSVSLFLCYFLFPFFPLSLSLSLCVCVSYSNSKLKVTYIPIQSKDCLSSITSFWHLSPFSTKFSLASISLGFHLKMVSSFQFNKNLFSSPAIPNIDWVQWHNVQCH
jgi:hypothetical protein